MEKAPRELLSALFRFGFKEGLHMSRIALFIDAAYLRYLLKEAPSEAAVDLKALIEKIRGGRDLLRTYYYDCLPWRADNPTAEQRARFAKQQKFYDGLFPGLASATPGLLSELRR